MNCESMSEVTPEFGRCGQAAGVNSERAVDGQLNAWMRMHLNPLLPEHLSIRLGNQLFFLRVEDAEGQVEGPGGLQGLLSVTDGCNGHACMMPMHRHGGNWEAALLGWGLKDTRTKKLIDPPDVIRGKTIEITDGELQDFAVQVIGAQIEKEDYALMSWETKPVEDPSLWFVGNDGPEWIIVRTARYHQKTSSCRATGAKSLIADRRSKIEYE